MTNCISSGEPPTMNYIASLSCPLINLTDDGFHSSDDNASKQASKQDSLIKTVSNKSSHVFSWKCGIRSTLWAILLRNSSCLSDDRFVLHQPVTV